MVYIVLISGCIQSEQEITTTIEETTQSTKLPETTTTITTTTSTKTTGTILTTTTTTTITTPTIITLPQPAVKEFNMRAFRYGYSPSTITVNKGDIVKIHIKSDDATHGFFIAEYGIDETITSDKTTDIEFTADKAGTFEFKCNVFCGAGHSSMKGKLIVK